MSVQRLAKSFATHRQKFDSSIETHLITIILKKKHMLNCLLTFAIGWFYTARLCRCVCSGYAASHKHFFYILYLCTASTAIPQFSWNQNAMYECIYYSERGNSVIGVPSTTSNSYVVITFKIWRRKNEFLISVKKYIIFISGDA